MLTLLGVDPGRSGGLAALLPDGTVRFKTMPKTEAAILHWFQDVPRPDGAYACIEWISPAIFGTAKSSMSKLYGSYRALRMALVAAAIPFDAVPARTWQRALLLPLRKKGQGRSAWKQQLKRQAQKFFPQLRLTLATADALLLLAYNRDCVQKRC